MKNRFNILDQVYHVTLESPVGVVVDWVYTASTNKVKYLVAFSCVDQYWLEDHEIVKTRVYAKN